MKRVGNIADYPKEAERRMQVSNSLLNNVLTALNGGGSPVPPFETFDAMNIWLNEFRQTQDAWITCIRAFNESESRVVKASCATLLVRKVQHDWTGLQNSEERITYRNLFLNMYATEIGQNTFDTLLIRQLVLLLVVSTDTAEDTMSLLQDACASLGAPHPPALYASLEMLFVLPDEFRRGTRRAHASLLPDLKERSGNVLGLLEERMQVTMAQNPGDASDLCRVLKAWIELPTIPGGLPETDIVTFRAQHPVTFNCLIGLCLEHGSEPALECMLVLLKGTVVDNDHVSGEFLNIFQTIASVLIGYRDCMLSANIVSGFQAAAIAQMGSALADCWPGGISGSMGTSCIDFARLMMECIKRPEVNVVESALEYFFAMNLTDLKDRKEELQLPFLVHLVQILAERLMYGLNDESDDIHYVDSIRDDDQYFRLRQDLVPDLLQEIYPALSLWYVEYAVQGIKSGNWKRVEISLYLLQAVDLQIRTQVLGNAGSTTTAKINSLLSDGFLVVSSRWIPSLIHGKRHVASLLGSQFCRTVDSFSVWSGKVLEAPLVEVFSGLLIIISLPEEVLDIECKPIACKAIKSLSTRAGEKMKQNVNLIQSLMESIRQALALQLPGEEDLLEAAILLGSRLEVEPFKNSLFQILRPYADQLIHISTLDSSGITQDDVDRVIISLAMIQRGFKCLVLSGLSHDIDEYSIPAFLFNSMQQTLTSIISSYLSGNPDILNGVVGVCKEAITVGGLALLDSISSVLLQIFKHADKPTASTFELLSEMIEVHYSDPRSIKSIMAISQAAFQQSFSYLQMCGIPSAPALVASLLDIAYSSIVYAPRATLETGCFPRFVDLAVAALECRESPGVIVNALEFLCYLPCAITDDDLNDKQTKDTIQNIIYEKGQFMMEALFYGLCETCPRSKMNAVSNLILSLLTQAPFKDEAKAWLQYSLQSSKVLKASQKVDSTLREKFCILATSSSLKPQRLGRMINDFGLISRNEEQIDALISY